MAKKEGSLLGGVLLISGSCIGAGMLGLPIVTGLAGFFPSLIIFFLAWLFMTFTGLLLVEAYGWFQKEVNFVSMVGQTLGTWGRIFCWILYLFLFYSLLVAYTAGSGALVSTFLQDLFPQAFPPSYGSLFFVLLFGGIVYLGTRAVDYVNRLMMAGLIITYAGLVLFAMRDVRPQLLFQARLPHMLISLPILVISFGFHNMIPSISAYLKGDLRRVRLSVIGGSFLALCVYLIWDFVVLGIVPLEGKWGLINSLKEGREASQSLSGILGAGAVGGFAQGFAFFAILTSFIAQALALVHFWADGLRIKEKKKETIPLCLLTLIPPLFFALLYPQIFYKALSFGGGICAVLLFGLFPALMAWRGRYLQKISSSYRVMGGKPLLLALALFALFIFFFQLMALLGVEFFPKL